MTLDQISLFEYRGDGLVLSREWNSKMPNGEPMSGWWVLRDAEGKMVDYDQYRNDIASRHDLTLNDMLR